ncbi:hypothetical protein ACFV6D_01575 [Kitasatospora sp. NPDC059812]|uniref:hypothetical protein n=1 Tax=Kitasatospora sp. NPDC059812 TaxID=3346958 RepID=UPI00365FBA4E
MSAEVWEPGDLVVDLNGGVWARAHPEDQAKGWAWGYALEGVAGPVEGAVEENYPPRPLTLLVRDGVAVNEPSKHRTARLLQMTVMAPQDRLKGPEPVGTGKHIAVRHRDWHPVHTARGTVLLRWRGTDGVERTWGGVERADGGRLVVRVPGDHHDARPLVRTLEEAVSLVWDWWLHPDGSGWPEDVEQLPRNEHGPELCFECGDVATLRVDQPYQRAHDTAAFTEHTCDAHLTEAVNVAVQTGSKAGPLTVTPVVAE